MTSKLRETRRSTRTPAIWRGRLANEIERVPIAQAVRGRVTIPWRAVSGLMVLSLLVVTALFFISDAFYINSIAVGGLRYMTSSEIFSLTNVTSMHVFWVDPAQVRTDIMRSATIADAEVNIGWPPNMVQIIVAEREPALVWEQAGTAVWIDLQGRVMRQREDRPDLLKIATVVDDSVGASVEQDIVIGAVQLQTLLPNTAVLRYDPAKGLGYNDPRGWEAWFGVGDDMAEKTLIYNAIVRSFSERGIEPVEINVSNPDAPVYSKRR